MTSHWFGFNNFKKITCSNDKDGLKHFNTLILDVEKVSCSNINQVFMLYLEQRQTKFVEVLYSGGLDSECVIASCLINKIPVRAVTMKLLVNGYPINTHDLYYSEKFCRQNGIEQKIVDLQVDHFFESGQYISYLEPYQIIEPHVATQFWLFEQCTGFPVLGGEYCWPWTHQNLISPVRHEYSYYDVFLKDQGINGIGNMLGHGLESNLMFITSHLKIFNNQIHDGNMLKIPKLKLDLYQAMGLGTFELRMRSYGWEGVPKSVIDKSIYRNHLLDKFGSTSNSISWGNEIAKAINGLPGTNDKFK